MDSNSRKLIEQAQLFQHELQTLMSQKGALTLEMGDVKRALDEIEKTDEKEVYKISGSILIKSDIGKVRKDLEEKKELVDVRLSAIEKRESKIKEKIDELKEKITGNDDE